MSTPSIPSPSATGMKTPERRTVAVVIPTYSNPNLLAECLDSLSALNYPRRSLEVIVVDNSSTDDAGRLLRVRYPQVHHLRLERNEGFAGACNRGAAHASAEYVAFLNDDAVAEPQWLDGLFAGLDAGGEGAVCAASRILSYDGQETEYSGASANLFGVGRPRSAWGWPDAPRPPGEGDPVLFASGGAMLVHRRTFLDAGGFDPHYFAYFEDVDLGWRLWVLGHRVVYAPDAVVRHVGGATGSRAPAHRRYTLWECNSLATVLKNYESVHMERILSAALLLLYRRALLSAGDALQPGEYRLDAPPDTNVANIEQLPKVSVAHLAAIDRFNRLLPHFMAERRRIQAARARPDSDILPLLGRLWEPQFAGHEYARAARALADALDLYGITYPAAPNRVLIIAGHGDADERQARMLAARLLHDVQVAVALVGVTGGPPEHQLERGYMVHTLQADSPALHGLVRQADAILILPGARHLEALQRADMPIALISSGTAEPAGPYSAIVLNAQDEAAIRKFCLRPRFHP